MNRDACEKAKYSIFLIRLTGTGILVQEAGVASKVVLGFFCTRCVRAKSCEDAAVLAKNLVYDELSTRVGRDSLNDMSLEVESVQVVRWNWFRRKPSGFTFYTEQSV